MVISVAEVVTDPDLAEPFVITRSQGGSFIAGVWSNQVITVNGYGVIQPSTPEELEQIPEGDRVLGAMSFHSADPLYETNTTGVNTPSGISDVIAWRNQTYRLVKIFPWEDFGYYKGIGVRMSGQ